MAKATSGNIVVHGVFEVEGPPPTSTEYTNKFKGLFEEFCKQIGRNALVGTFDDFSQEIFPDRKSFNAFNRAAQKLSRCVSVNSDADIQNGRYQFKLTLDHAVFSDKLLGFQKLVHVLVSDLFELRGIGDLRGQVRITSVKLGGLVTIFQNAYRQRSHTIVDIRRHMELGADEPLLAFTLKPRTGLTDEDYKTFAAEVFDGGFNVVEMDTRDLDVTSADRIALFEALTKIALKKSSGSKVCRFSANLSGPFHIVQPALEAIWRNHEQAGTDAWVVKVDGNLDGLSTIQAIRNWCSDNDIPQPIITCYPVLKYGLLRYLGPDTLYHLMVLSGADIIYPGSRPRFDADKAIDGAQLSPARSHYEGLRYPDGYPLPSVAGGTLIGHVPATLALLGTDIAFFVGGGIALSKMGVKEGAKAFRGALDESRKLLKEREWRKSNVRDRFVSFTRIYAKKGETLDPAFEMIDPCDLVGKVDELAIEEPNVKD